MKRIYALLLLALSAGCPIDVQPTAQECVDQAPRDAGTLLTWHRDIAPIFATKCMVCHEGKGPGPLQL